MGKGNRLVGYLASVASASLFYVVWEVIIIGLIGPPGEGTGVLFKITFAFTIFLVYGPCAAFVLMVLPWYLAVLWHDRLRFGLIYFPMVGAATTLVMSCATCSLAPKMLFVEDETFLGGFLIAVERQGICLLLTGFLFGLTFWLVSERLRYSNGLLEAGSVIPLRPAHDEGSDGPARNVSQQR